MRARRDKNKGWCTECSQTVSNLKTHKYVHHSVKREALQCSSCSYAELPIDTGHFRRHLRTHMGLPEDDLVRRYGVIIDGGYVALQKCAFCLYRCATHALLVSHEAQHHPGRV